MKPKFCPACGRETEKLFDKLCESCFSENHKLAELPEKIKIRLCSNCGKIEGVARIRRLDEDGMKKIIRNKIKVDGKITSMKIRGKAIGKNINLEVEIHGLLNGDIEKSDVLKTRIEIKERLCETCGKVKGGYYEVVIQIRSEDKDKIENALGVLENMIRKKGVMTKIEEKKEGVDIYFTPKKILGYLIKNLPKTKEIKRSYSLATKKDGKDLYRNTVLVRL